MASIPGARFNISGASGSQGLLSPSSSWRCYVFPRGGYASSSSSGTNITFDSAAVASRFAANNWIQVGTDISTIRKISAVGGNSISVSGAAVAVTLNNRVLVIGNTQPTTVGGSATYLVPQSQIFQRDDDGSTTFTNSMITTDNQGLVQFFGGPAVFDVLIQDGNGTNQGLIIDLPVGAVEGISTAFASIFGATVTFVMGVSVNGPAFIGQSLTVHGGIGVTGAARFDSTTLVGQTLTVNGAFGTTGWGTFGASVTVAGALGVTGTLAVGATATITGRLVLGESMTISGGISQSGYAGANNLSGRIRTAGNMTALHYNVFGGGTLTSSDCFLSSGWGTSATVTPSTFATDDRGNLQIVSAGTGQAANPTVGITFTNSFSQSIEPCAVACRGASFSQLTIPMLVKSVSLTNAIFQFQGTPVAGETYSFFYMVLG